MYTLNQVSKTYHRGGRPINALKDLSLHIPDGAFIAIQGKTGGGKSTLLQLLGALDRPTSGSIQLGEDRLEKLSVGKLDALRGKRIGIVFQTFNLIPTLTALDNVASGLVPLGVPANERRRRAIEALTSLGLEERLTHLPSELSGGQQQRVAIARALVKEPEVLLADEPTGNLDEDTRTEIVELLMNLWRDKGITLIIVTHDTWVAQRAQRQYRLTGGRLTQRAA